MMTVTFLQEDDFTDLAVDIECSDPKALMLFWEMTPEGTRVSQTLTRSLSVEEIGALLITAKAGVELTKSLIDLAKTLRRIKDDKPDVKFSLRVRYGSQVRDSQLGPLRTTDWEVQFQRETQPRFVGDEALAAAARAREINGVSDE